MICILTKKALSKLGQYTEIYNNIIFQKQLFFNNFFWSLKILTLTAVVIISISGLAFSGNSKIKMPRSGMGPGYVFYNQNDWDALPIYCKAKFLPESSPLTQKWKKKIGPDFQHMHHYCRGLTFLRKGKMEFINKRKKNEFLRTAIDEIGYMIGHSSKKLNKKFRALMLKQRTEAEMLLTK